MAERGQTLSKIKETKVRRAPIGNDKDRNDFVISICSLFFLFPFVHLTYYTAYQVGKISLEQKSNATFAITAGVIVIRIRVGVEITGVLWRFIHSHG